jgi:hypothetical protein
LILFGAVCAFWAWVDACVYAELRLPEPPFWFGRFIMAKAVGLPWAFLMIVYGIFIPNTWRRCAAVVGIVGMAPLVISAATSLAKSANEGHSQLDYYVDLAGWLAAAAAVATYGAHRIELLREEVRAARPSLIPRASLITHPEPSGTALWKRMGGCRLSHTSRSAVFASKFRFSTVESPRVKAPESKVAREYCVTLGIVAITGMGKADEPWRVASNQCSCRKSLRSSWQTAQLIPSRTMSKTRFPASATLATSWVSTSSTPQTSLTVDPTEVQLARDSAKARLNSCRRASTSWSSS